MEPERDIEKELKAYAQQRRAAAGTPPPLHPVNRKALQAEAARLAKSPDVRSRSWWQILFGSGPRLAAVGTAVVVVVTLTWQLFPRPESKQETFHTFAATRFAPARGPAEEPKAAIPPPPSAVPMSLAEDSGAGAKSSIIVHDKESGPQPAPVSAPVAIAPPAPAPAAPSTLALNAPAARDRVPLTSSGQLGESGLVPQQTPANGGAFAGSPRSFNRLATTDSLAVPVTQRFRRTDPSAKTSKALGVSNLLSSFKVEQDLGKLRIIDSDGSVYFGFVEQSPETFKEAEAQLEKVSPQKDAAKSKATQPVQAFHFRVSGTNRTLKEEVVFTGNFLAGAAPQTSLKAKKIPDDNAPALGAPATVTQGIAGQPVLFELRKARTEGRLFLGGTNKLEIKAAPVKP